MGGPGSGRTAKPSVLRVLEGDTRRDRMRKEPVPRKGAPECPSWLSPAARKVWQETVPDLDAIGLLARADLGVLASYCEALAEYATAVRQRHNGAPDRSTVLVLGKLEARMLSAARELGLTPAARSRMGTKSDSKQERDELDEMLAQPVRRNR